MTIAIPSLLLLVTAASGDACRVQIPQSVSAAITASDSRWLGLELPLETDNRPEDVASDRKHGGTGCLGVAKAEFDGDGKRDIALVTITPHGEVVLVAALARGNSWKIEIVSYTHYFGREFVVITTAPPGRYSPDPKDTKLSTPVDLRPVQVKTWGLLEGGGATDPSATSSDLWYRYGDNDWARIFGAVR